MTIDRAPEGRIVHEILPDGESTEKWAIRTPGFLSSIKRLSNCARCGEALPPKHHNQPRHFRDVTKPTMHVICDHCWEELPE